MFTMKNPLDKNADEFKIQEKQTESGYVPLKYIYPPESVFPEETYDMETLHTNISIDVLSELQASNILENEDHLIMNNKQTHSAQALGSIPVNYLNAIKFPGKIK